MRVLSWDAEAVSVGDKGELLSLILVVVSIFFQLLDILMGFLQLVLVHQIGNSLQMSGDVMILPAKTKALFLKSFEIR